MMRNWAGQLKSALHADVRKNMIVILVLTFILGQLYELTIGSRDGYGILQIIGVSGMLIVVWNLWKPKWFKFGFGYPKWMQVGFLVLGVYAAYGAETLLERSPDIAHVILLWVGKFVGYVAIGLGMLPTVDEFVDWALDRWNNRRWLRR